MADLLHQVVDEEVPQRRVRRVADRDSEPEMPLGGGERGVSVVELTDRRVINIYFDLLIHVTDMCATWRRGRSGQAGPGGRALGAGHRGRLRGGGDRVSQFVLPEAPGAGTGVRRRAERRGQPLDPLPPTTASTCPARRRGYRPAPHSGWPRHPVRPCGCERPGVLDGEHGRPGCRRGPRARGNRRRSAWRVYRLTRLAPEGGLVSTAAVQLVAE